MRLGDILGRTDLTDKFVLQKFLCTFLSCSREELWTDMDKQLSDDFIQKILAAYKSYVEDKKPLEYILGHVDFFGKEFFVNEATLIPRPETEYMITAVTEYIQQMQDARCKIQISDSNDISGVMSHESNFLLDIGTGCGVLGISVLLQNPTYFSQVVFSDYFANALEVAQKNYHTLVKEYVGKVEFVQSDLLQFVEHGVLSIDNSNIILVANLPYIPEEMFESNVSDNVKKWEPKPAFVGGNDGLDYYRKMFDQIIQFVEHGVLRLEHGFVMFLEMMTWQVDVLRQEFGDRLEFDEVKTFHFNIRIVKCWLK